MRRFIVLFLLSLPLLAAEPVEHVEVVVKGRTTLLRAVESTIVYPAVGGMDTHWTLKAGTLSLETASKTGTLQELQGKSFPARGSYDGRRLSGAQVKFERVHGAVLEGTFRCQELSGRFRVQTNEIALP